MHLEDFEAIMRRVPFKPFVMVLDNSDQFEVKHPDQLILNERFVAFGTRQVRDVNSTRLVIFWIDIAHIAYLCRS
ncbi:hypothetical protein ETAA8_53470 [Anatilimnocola aggregata]|uniref:Uncharacterized protein n=1 Tax=Anatilimnocola aggregata TaxID=2528021 RepID=A0A517YJ22_9BACT|nr:hypothetical protein [Anatilimnocola aggregata]QDU30228.1 hypothetical protein ETAA8_53470 [Anatilimnocola aggregata]